MLEEGRRQDVMGFRDRQVLLRSDAAEIYTGGITMDEEWKDRIAVEYHQLSSRIDRLEKALLTMEFPDDEQKDLLIEQRNAMLHYKEILFKRCLLNKVDLYKYHYTCKPEKDGEL